VKHHGVLCNNSRIVELQLQKQLCHKTVHLGLKIFCQTNVISDKKSSVQEITTAVRVTVGAQNVGCPQRKK
jgi:hypothetical protein